MVFMQKNHFLCAKLYSTTGFTFMQLRHFQCFKFIFIASLVLLVLSTMFTSCISPKSVIYFQGDTARFSADHIKQEYYSVIQPNDLLTVVVGSLNAEANEIFSAASAATAGSVNYNAAGAAQRTQPIGYLVDKNGMIELPLVGKVKVSGLESAVAADTIKARLLYYLKEPTVAVRNINFKVSVLGEVNRPAVYGVPEEKISLPEVLSMAGDLTIYGRRDNVLVIREVNGVREYAHVDLTSREIFDSPYYYLYKNDVVYVEPIKARMTTTDRTMQLLPLVLSSLSVITIILTRVL